MLVERRREKRDRSSSERISLSLFYLGSIETALRRRGAQSAAGDDRPPRERRGDAFEMVKEDESRKLGAGHQRGGKNNEERKKSVSSSKNKAFISFVFGPALKKKKKASKKTHPKNMNQDAMKHS